MPLFRVLSREFNHRFHHEPACQKDTAFVPVPADFDLDTLLAAKYSRKTDNGQAGNQRECQATGNLRSRPVEDRE
jgi:hypothetical protein